MNEMVKIVSFKLCIFYKNFENLYFYGTLIPRMLIDIIWGKEGKGFSPQIKQSGRRTDWVKVTGFFSKNFSEPLVYSSAL